MFKILFCVLLVVSGSWSQAQAQQANNSRPNMIEKYGPRRQISTIVYMGLAGAVLGLSTLSFYGRPQDKLTNIPIGFGVGVVIGTIYMTYQAAANPDEFYKQSELEYVPRFSDPTPKEYSASEYLVKKKEAQQVSYRWTF